MADGSFQWREGNKMALAALQKEYKCLLTIQFVKLEMAPGKSNVLYPGVEPDVPTSKKVGSDYNVVDC